MITASLVAMGVAVWFTVLVLTQLFVPPEPAQIDRSADRPGPALRPRAAVRASRPAPPCPLYRMENVTKTWGYGGHLVRALRGVDLEIAGGVTAITGPNGSGKSTLLTLLGGLDAPTGGRIFYRGELLPFADRRAMNRFRGLIPAWIMQDTNLFADQSAAENVAFALTRFGERHGVALAAARELLQTLGIDGRSASRLPSQLSGGQRQRVAIARALLAHQAGGAEVILADEPTASVDSADAERVFCTLLDLAHDQGAPVIVVTHNPALARLADRVLICEHGTFREAGFSTREAATPGGNHRVLSLAHDTAFVEEA
jgi:putative ABC transport system ATP-binding protein